MTWVAQASSVGFLLATTRQQAGDHRLLVLFAVPIVTKGCQFAVFAIVIHAGHIGEKHRPSGGPWYQRRLDLALVCRQLLQRAAEIVLVKPAHLQELAPPGRPRWTAPPSSGCSEREGALVFAWIVSAARRNRTKAGLSVGGAWLSVAALQAMETTTYSETPASPRRATVELVLFLAVWMLPGVLGRDPWKADEGYSFGLVFHMLETGDWVIPQLAGEPFMQKPPLLFALSALSADLFSWLLPLHDGARGSVVFFNSLTFVALGLAARELWGPGQGWLAPVLFLGAPGLIHNQHMMVTDVALMTGFAVGHYGLALCRRRRWFGGFVAGTGIGVAFMAKGLIGPGLMGLSALALPVLFKPWRNRAYFCSLLAMGLASLPWVAIWPALVYARSPELFREWFVENNLGRFTGTTKLVRSKSNYLFYVKILPWFALPSVALAAWYWWSRRREWRVNVGLQLTLVSFLVMFAVFSVSRQARTLYAQPMVVPLALAGILAVDWMAGRPARIINRFCAVAFVGIVTVAWLAWALILAQWPAALWTTIHARIPEFVPAFSWLAFLPAAGGTVWFLWHLRQTEFASGRAAVVNWAAGLGLGYLLGMTLFLPLANANMGYRGVFIPLRAHLPPAGETVASIGLAESERGLLHYIAGLKTRRVEVAPQALDDCDWVFIQGNFKRNRHTGPPPRGEWDLVFEGKRAGDESYRLYRRATPPR